MTVDRPLLETKLYRPTQTASLVSRPRLLDRIQCERKLTLISAPAGFGKTTLLAEWIHALPTQGIAWVSLDQSDNDPAFFWSYAISALQKVQANLGVRSLSLLQSPQPSPIESVLMALLNDLSAVEADITLVLDDYHVVESQAIHHGIGFLLSHLPPHVHLILSSRADPPLPLARLRSRGELTELRVRDLRFTPDEATAFLNQVMGLAISAGDVSALELRTEGWIAGLQLAALSLQGREDISEFVADFSGNDRYIVDYLIEEVLHRQPERVRRFLLQTAILDRLSSSLCNAVCDAVTNQSDGQDMLETLERDNLFIMPLDNKRQWYRYHHLFADVLLAHALTELSEHMPSLHSRASDWYEQHDLFSNAIHHALAAQDFERAADLIEQVWPTMRQRQQESTVLSWIKLLPESLIRDHPALSVAYAVVLLTAGQLNEVETHLENAEKSAERGLAQLEESAPENSSASSKTLKASKEQYRSVLASVANTRAFRAQALSDFSGAITYAQQALTLLPTEDDNERGVTAAFLGLAYWTSGNAEAAYQSFFEGLQIFQKLGSIQIAVCGTLVLANIGMAQGRLRAAIAACEQALQLADQQPVPLQQGTPDLYLALSEIRYEQGDLDFARQLLEKGESLREQGSVSGTDYLWWLVKAQLTAAQGDLEAALDQLHEAARLYRRSPVPDVRPVEALKVRWWLRQGRLAEALSWVKSCGLSVDDPPAYLREYEHLTLARVLISQYRQDRKDEVIHQISALLKRLLAAAEEKNRTGSIIEILLVLALADEAQGNMEGAIESLEQALTLAEPEGYIRIFIDHGKPMMRLLQAARSITPAYTHRLLTALQTMGQPQNAAPTSLVDSVQQSLIEPLSQRELDVLRLLNTELSGPEIARELVVALSTVRTHTKRIYSKLNVSNRRAALNRAAELGLL